MLNRYIFFSLKSFFFFLLLFLNSTNLEAQKPAKNDEDLKKKAAKLFDDKKYIEATASYSQLLSLFPKDPEMHFRYGACLVYSEKNKEKPVSYLEFASKQAGISPEVYFFLGRAYHLNYRFNDALNAFDKFNSLADAKSKKKYNIQQAIEMSKNGKELVKNVIDIKVLDKKDLNDVDYFRSYDLGDFGGKIITKPDDFKTDLDKKEAENSIMFLPNNAEIVYFSSYTKSDEIHRDIYFSKKNDKGEWSAPQSLGEPINTVYDEEFPFLHPNGKILYFCSKGHNSMGGYDIFKSELDEKTGKWKTPQNLDFAISSPDDDILFITDKDNQKAFFASRRSSVGSKITIYKIEVKTSTSETVLLAGKFTPLPVDIGNINSTITVSELETGRFLGIFNPDKKTGNYLMNVPSGKQLKFVVQTPGVPLQSGNVFIPKFGRLKTLKQEMLLEQDDKGVRLVINNLFDEPVDEEKFATEYYKMIAELDVKGTEEILAKAQEVKEEPKPIAKPSLSVEQMEMRSILAWKKAQELSNELKILKADLDNAKQELLTKSNTQDKNVQNEKIEELNKKIFEKSAEAQAALLIAQLADNKNETALMALNGSETQKNILAKNETAANLLVEKASLQSEITSVKNEIKGYESKLPSMKEGSDKDLTKDNLEGAKEDLTSLEKKMQKLLTRIAEVQSEIKMEEKKLAVSQTLASQTIDIKSSESVIDKPKITESLFDLGISATDNNLLVENIKENVIAQNEPVKEAEKPKETTLSIKSNPTKSEIPKTETSKTNTTNSSQNANVAVNNAQVLNENFSIIDAQGKVVDYNQLIQQELNKLKNETNETAKINTEIKLFESWVKAIDSEVNYNDSLIKIAAENADDAAINRLDKRNTELYEQLGEKNKLLNEAKNKLLVAQNTEKSNIENQNNSSVAVVPVNNQIIANQPKTADNQKVTIENNTNNQVDNLSETNSAQENSTSNPSSKFENIEDYYSSLKPANAAEVSKPNFEIKNANGDLLNYNPAFENAINDVKNAGLSEIKTKEKELELLVNWKNAILQEINENENQISTANSSTDNEKMAFLKRQNTFLKNNLGAKNQLIEDKKSEINSLETLAKKEASDSQNTSENESFKPEEFDKVVSNSTEIFQDEILSNSYVGSEISKANTLKAQADQLALESKNKLTEASKTTNSDKKNELVEESMKLDRQLQDIRLKEVLARNRANKAAIIQNKTKLGNIPSLNLVFSAKDDENYFLVEEAIKNAELAQKQGNDFRLAAEKENDKTEKYRLYLKALEFDSAALDNQSLIAEAYKLKKYDFDKIEITKENVPLPSRSQAKAKYERQFTTNASNLSARTLNEVENNNNYLKLFINKEHLFYDLSLLSVDEQETVREQNQQLMSVENQLVEANSKQQNLTGELENLKLANSQKISKKIKKANEKRIAEIESQLPLIKLDIEDYSSKSEKLNKSLSDLMKSYNLQPIEILSGESNTISLNEINKPKQTENQFNISENTLEEKPIENKKDSISDNNTNSITENTSVKSAEISTISPEKTEAKIENKVIDENNAAKENPLPNNVSKSDEITENKTIDSKSVENNIEKPITETNTISQNPASNNVLKPNEIAENKTVETQAIGNNVEKSNVATNNNSEKEIQQNVPEKKVENVATNNVSNNNELDENKPLENKTNETKPIETKVEKANLIVSNVQENEVKKPTLTKEEKAEPIAKNEVEVKKSTEKTATKNENTKAENAQPKITNQPIQKLSQNTFVKVSGPVYSDSKPIPIDEPLPEGLVYKIQVGAFRNPIPQTLFKGFSPISGQRTSSGITRYFAGSFLDFKDADAAKQEIRNLGYRDAFVVAFRNGTRVNINDATGEALSLNPINNAASSTNLAQKTVDIPVNPGAAKFETIKKSDELFFTVQVGVYSNQIPPSRLNNLQPLFVAIAPNGFLRYNLGSFTNFDAANDSRQIALNAGINDAFVTAYYGGQRISVEEARRKLNEGVKVSKPKVSNQKPIEQKSIEPEIVNNGSVTNNLVENVKSKSANGLTFKVQLGAFKEEVPNEIAQIFFSIRKYGVENFPVSNGLTVYTAGDFKTYNEANNLKNELMKMDGLSNIFVISLLNNEKIDINKAIEMLNNAQ